MAAKGKVAEEKGAASATTAADPATKKNKLIRPRGKRGGIKKKHVKDELTGRWSRTNIPATKPKDKEDKQKQKKHKPAAVDQDGESVHAKHISNFHALQKRLASPATTPDERAQIEAQLSELGGLKAYQDASLVGASAHGECGVWVGTSLLAHLPSLKSNNNIDSSSSSSRGGSSATTTTATTNSLASKKKRKFRMLDVGAIRGTAYDRFGDWMEAISIDLNPRSEKVFQADFLDCEVPPHRIIGAEEEEEEQQQQHSRKEEEEEKRKGGPSADVSSGEAVVSGESITAFTPTPLPQSQVSAGFDFVSLSLVVNFEGDLHKRGEMLLRPHAFLRSSPPQIGSAKQQQQQQHKKEKKGGGAEEGGYLVLILPLPCVTKSRYCTPEHLSDMLKSAGWTVVVRQDSKRLTRWLLREKPGVRREGEVGCEGGEQGLWERWWDGRQFGRKEVLVGVRLNNFCIKLVGREERGREVQDGDNGDDGDDNDDDDDAGVEDEGSLSRNQARTPSKGNKKQVSKAGKNKNSNGGVGGGKLTSSLHSTKKNGRRPPVPTSQR